MKILKHIGILGILLFSHSEALAVQHGDTYPETGKPIPYFELKNIADHTYTQTNRDELRGKFVILYFWSRFCTEAVKSLPRIDALHKEFGNNVEIILIGGERAGLENKYMLPGHKPGMDHLKTLYGRIKKAFGMHLPITFDPELFQRFVPGGNVPHAVWIDDKGVVQAITTTVNAEKIKAFVHKKPFVFRDRSYKSYRRDSVVRAGRYRAVKEEKKNTVILYTSTLAEYKTGMPSRSYLPMSVGDIFTGKKNSGNTLEGVGTVVSFYKMAYTGYRDVPQKDRKTFYDKYYNSVVINIKNDSLFGLYDHEDRKFIYYYSLTVPPEKASPQKLMSCMQHDLHNYFGYTAQMETRELPYWSIRIKDKAKRALETRGGKYLYTGDNFTRVGYRNVPVNRYLTELLYLVSNDRIPIIDETGTVMNIDIATADVIWWDFEAVKRLLRQQGFIVEKRRKNFEVLVIED